MLRKHVLTNHAAVRPVLLFYVITLFFNVFDTTALH
jgi:hypothetical protein